MNPTKQTFDEQGTMVETVMTAAEYSNWQKAIAEANAYLATNS
jgi:hypothetical protein